MAKIAITRADNIIITSRIKPKVNKVIRVNKIRISKRVKRVKIVY